MEYSPSVFLFSSINLIEINTNNSQKNKVIPKMCFVFPNTFSLLSVSEKNTFMKPTLSLLLISMLALACSKDNDTSQKNLNKEGVIGSWKITSIYHSNVNPDGTLTNSWTAASNQEQIIVNSDSSYQYSVVKPTSGVIPPTIFYNIPNKGKTIVDMSPIARDASPLIYFISGKDTSFFGLSLIKDTMDWYVSVGSKELYAKRFIRTK